MIYQNDYFWESNSCDPRGLRRNQPSRMIEDNRCSLKLFTKCWEVGCSNSSLLFSRIVEIQKVFSCQTLMYMDCNVFLRKEKSCIPVFVSENLFVVRLN